MGLGNPGEAYERTRHNVGFLAVEQFAAQAGFPPPRRKFLVRYTERKIDGEQVYLLEPETFMNASGPAVRDLVGYFGKAPALEALEESLLVVHDDLDLEPGRLRFRSGGSSGGHRGIQSMIEALGSGAFARLKVGVGRPVGKPAAAYVLERLSGKENEELSLAANAAADTFPVWIRDGLERCANRFNAASSRAGPDAGGKRSCSSPPRG